MEKISSGGKSVSFKADQVPKENAYLLLVLTRDVCTLVVPLSTYLLDTRCAVRDLVRITSAQVVDGECW